MLIFPTILAGTERPEYQHLSPPGGEKGWKAAPPFPDKERPGGFHGTTSEEKVSPGFGEAEQAFECTSY